jgi:phage terminase large subunit
MQQTTIDISAAVFNAAYYPYLDSTARTQIFFGGSGSGKSWFVAERCLIDVMRGVRNYLVCRQVGRTIRGSVFQQILRVMAEWGIASLFSVNKSDMLITCISNGYQIIFVGLDDVEKLKSLTPAKGARTDIWIEESTETSMDTVKQLYKRQRGGEASVPKRVTFSFNPILQSHWIYDEFFAPLGWSDTQTVHESESLLIVKTWYKHNRFLTPDDVRDLENESDEYYRSVYTYGNWGTLGNVIFKNWTTADLSGMRAQFTHRKHGLDFGFSSDPAALVETHYDRKRKTIYIYDELYERGMTNDVLARAVKAIIGDDLVTCDSAEPKSIAELEMFGVKARGAAKGKDSVIYGIQWLQQQTIIIDERCVNMINELRSYHWKEDKAGNAIRQPVDKNNHLIDALRYAYEDENETSWADVATLGRVEGYVNPWA